MHSRFRIPDIQHHQDGPEENHQMMISSSMNNQARDDDDDNILEQIRRHGGGGGGHTSFSATSTQPLFMNHHHHHHQQFPPPHHYGVVAAPSSSSFFPLNFKLGLGEYCARSSVVEEEQQRRRSCISSYSDDHINEVGRGVIRTTSAVCGNINEGEEAAALALLIRGSEQYEAVPEAARRHTITSSSSLGIMHHCWHNQEDSAIIKQPPIWEAEVSNENSEIVDKQDNSDKNNRHAQAKSRVHFGELEAIYKRLGSTTAESDQTGGGGPISEPLNTTSYSLPPNHMLDHGSEDSIGEHHHHHQHQQESASIEKSSKKRKKKTKKKNKHDVMIDPMTEFFGNLVKQVMEHQENLHLKFAEAVERLDAERRKREEAWRSQELAHFQREAAERARQRDLAESREATVISYLEKITGEKINLPPKFGPSSYQTKKMK